MYLKAHYMLKPLYIIHASYERSVSLKALKGQFIILPNLYYYSLAVISTTNLDGV